MNPYLEILRPGNAIMAVIAVILIAIIGKNYNIPIILGIIAVFLATGAGNAINDYFDYKIDAINKPNRPIPSGRISLKTARIYSIILFLIAIVIGFIISFFVNSYLPTIIVIFNSILMYYYAYSLKSSVLFGNMAIAFLTASCFIFAGTILDLINISLYLGFFAFSMTLAREIIKDMEDYKGDKLEGAKTLPIKYGMKISAILAAIFILLASLLSPILYLNGIFNVYYLIPLGIAILIFLIAAFKILSDQSSENSRFVSKLIKIGMLIAFIAFAIGSF
ncbi:MAG: UbiA family prenyltransferase [Methanobrevibacter sp.]|jgi:geranylgeranylglycerol-phosphate geranylgeranyltransferase|nr:UbiA family prenyltransferase [Methanobrevibacter sp.]